MLESSATASGYDGRAEVAEFYDYFPLYAARDDVGFYVEEAVQAGGHVVELGCGTGRILIPIARAGVQITGIDASRSMLATCAAKLAREDTATRARTRVVRGDITDFSVGESATLAIAPFRSFQHLIAVDEQLACLHCVHRCLKSGGRFILDVFHTQAERMHDPRFSQPEIEVENVLLPDGRHFARSGRTAAFHRAIQVNDIELIYDVTHPDGRNERFVHAFPMRYYFRYELEHLLARAGFTLEAVYGDFQRDPIEDGSRDMIFIARKAG